MQMIINKRLVLIISAMWLHLLYDVDDLCLSCVIFVNLLLCVWTKIRGLISKNNCILESQHIGFLRNDHMSWHCLIDHSMKWYGYHCVQIDNDENVR